MRGMLKTQRGERFRDESLFVRERSRPKEQASAAFPTGAYRCVSDRGKTQRGERFRDEYFLLRENNTLVSLHNFADDIGVYAVRL